MWIHQLHPSRRDETFEALRMTGAMLGRCSDPLLAVDHFRMSGPTFPPHAHAGFSAVTYVLPESPGGMRNRDGLGDSSLIRPGGLHWTASGRGLVHEEVPDSTGSLVEGLQIFIRQPASQEQAKPAIHHVEPDEIPQIMVGDGRLVRVVAGAFGGRNAPFAPPSPVQLLDITLAPGPGIEWDNPWDGAGVTLYLFSGAIEIGGPEVTPAAPAAIVFPRGTRTLRLAATIGDARLMLFAGAPLDAPTLFAGGFALSSSTALDEAMVRYRRGEMGRIAERVG